MTNAELIKALRICANQTCCDNCPRYDIDHTQDAQRCYVQLINNAADALEALQARADKQDAEITELLAVITKNDTEMDNLKTELLNAQDDAKYERQRLRLCEENFEATMASETTYREMCEALQAQLPKEGEWIENDEGDSIYFKCSVCGKNQYNVLLEMMQGEYHYCPNCGARMRGEHDGET